jgi:hypothetical protein
MHAIERILYSNTTPPHVVLFEESLPGYMAAAFPATADEAAAFKGGLCDKFVSDAKELENEWTPTNIRAPIAFQGLISLVLEQREKVEKAASDEEESRYSQRTMADLRNNLTGSETVYGLFQPWITSKEDPGDPKADGPSIDGIIDGGFATLESAYGKVQGDAIPAPPATWSAESPSPTDLLSPFGVLYTAVRSAVDPTADESIVSQMNNAALLLGFP